MTDKVKKAIEQLERISNSLASIGETVDYTDIAIQALEQTRWIPCSERLPEERGCYLVTYKWKGKHSGTVYTETDVIEYDEMREKWVCGDGDIIAWMPLPQPYKESDESETN